MDRFTVKYRGATASGESIVDEENRVHFSAACSKEDYVNLGSKAIMKGAGLPLRSRRLIINRSVNLRRLLNDEEVLVGDLQVLLDLRKFYRRLRARSIRIVREIACLLVVNQVVVRVLCFVA